MDQATAPDFFISYTESDVAWAQWIAVTLEDAGYLTVSQVLDMLPGNDFAHAMHQAATTARRTIAVLSPAYLASPFGEAEWRVAFRADPTGERALVVPVMVASCRPTGLLSTRVYIDLVGVDEATARRRLLVGVAPQLRPSTAGFPRPAGPATGASLSISNLPARNRSFAGRVEALEDLHRRMTISGMTAVVPVVSVAAVHGLGGVGKSELAVEYAHRHGGDYDIRWWILAEDPTGAAAGLARLATRLGISTDADDAEVIERLFDQLRQRDRWLLIYDNAEQPEYLDGLLPPAGTGHVIVTSRWSMWGRIADSVGLQVLRREESVEFLRRRLPSRGDSLAAELAELLGDLPLALEEAAAYLEATSTGMAEYLDLVRRRARELFGLSSQQRPDTDRRRVATIWSLSLDRLRDEAPEAEHLLTLIAFLAPDVPRELPTLAPHQLPDGLAAAVADPISYHALLAALARYSVASVGFRTVGLHRLVAEVVRARLDSAQERAWAMTSLALLRAAYPADGDEDGLRTELLPHVATAVGHAQRLQIGAIETRRLLEQTTGRHAEQSNLGRLDVLAAAAAGGDRAALEMFLADAEVLVRRIVVAQLGSFGNVDDTVQDALVAIDRRLENGGLGDRPAVAFVAQVTRVVVEDAWRRVAAELEQPTREFPDLADPRPEPGQWIESMDIQKALASLSSYERAVIVLGVVEGISDAETAAVLGTSRASVRVTQHRALARLRTLLQ